MKKGLTELVFILDRSGSMSGLEADTIGGFNGLIEKQKKEEGEALVSVVLFDDQTEVLYDRIDLKKIEPMNDRQYYVRGSTALLDAVGGAIHHIKALHNQEGKENAPEKTLFIITTDGMENASRKYSYEKVRKMVEHEKAKRHWEFLFLGANMDAVKVAHQFGLKANRAVRYESDSMGTALNFQVMSKVVSSARCAGSAAMMESAFDSSDALADIREDYADFEEAQAMHQQTENISEEEKRRIEAAFDRLSAREKEIAEHIFGLNGNPAQSYEEVSIRCNIPDTRVRQLAVKIRRKAKSGRREKSFAEYLA